jgi:hypothetical protein
MVSRTLTEITEASTMRKLSCVAPKFVSTCTVRANLSKTTRRMAYVGLHFGMCFKLSVTLACVKLQIA